MQDCWHGHSATPRLPVDYKLHYHTIPMKSLSSFTTLRTLGRKFEEDSLHPMRAWFLHSKHTKSSMQSWQFKTKLDCPTPPLHSCPNPSGLGGNIFSSTVHAPPSPNQRASSESPDLVKGTWQVKGHNWQPMCRRTWHGTPMSLCLYVGWFPYQWFSALWC